jgi:hypothetical protein
LLLQQCEIQNYRRRLHRMSREQRPGKRLIRLTKPARIFLRADPRHTKHETYFF